VTEALDASADGDAPASRALSQFFLARRDFDRAEEFARKGVEADPGDGWALANLVEVLRRRGDRAMQPLLHRLIEFDDPALAGRALHGAFHCGDLDLLARAYGIYRRGLEDGTLAESAAVAGHTLENARIALGEFDAVIEAAAAGSAADDRLPFGAGEYRAIIVDPGFSRLDGHHLHHNKFFDRFLTSRGRQPAVYTPRELGAFDDSGELAIRPRFIFQPYRYEPLLADPAAARRVNAFFAHDAALSPIADTVEIVAVHSLRLSFALGFADWLLDSRRTGAKGLRQVLIGVIEADCASPDHPHHESARAIYSEMLEKLAEIRDLDIILFAETEVVRDFLLDLSDIDVHVEVYPYLAAGLVREHAGAAARDPDGPLRVGFVGGTRANRGVEIIPALVRKTADMAGTLEWHVQLDLAMLRQIMTFADWQDAAGFTECPHLTLYPPNLPTADYGRLLDSIDVVLLPYDTRYMVSGSGVFFEALMLGKLPLVPKRSFMHAVLADLGFPDLSIDGSDPDLILERLRHIAHNRTGILETARQRAEHWRQTFSPESRFARRFDEAWRADSARRA
jgi:hypothetical protein